MSLATTTTATARMTRPTTRRAHVKPVDDLATLINRQFSGEATCLDWDDDARRLVEAIEHRFGAATTRDEDVMIATDGGCVVLRPAMFVGNNPIKRVVLIRSSATHRV